MTTPATPSSSAKPHPHTSTIRIPSGAATIFLHLITLCIGLLIAAGLQQTYEFIQRRRRERAYLKAQIAAQMEAHRQPSEGPPPPSPDTAIR